MSRRRHASVLCFYAEAGAVRKGAETEGGPSLRWTGDPAEIDRLVRAKIAEERAHGRTDEYIIRHIFCVNQSYPSVRAIAARIANCFGMTEAQFVRTAGPRGRP